MTLFREILARIVADKRGDDPSVDEQQDFDILDPRKQHVIEFLDDREGVAWQRDIQSHQGWSPAKTSPVVSKMENTGQVRRYQSGRQKLVSLPSPEQVSFPPRDGSAPDS